jgi:hypothetical protein
MARRRMKRRTRQRSDELVREVVAAVVPARERVRYVAFARELYATLQLGRKQGTVPAKNWGQSLGVAQGPVKVQSPFFARAVQSPFSSRNKRVVMKWFRRGLHGNLLWRIGVALLGRLYPDAATGKVDD